MGYGAGLLVLYTDKEGLLRPGLLRSDENQPEDDLDELLEALDKLREGLEELPGDGE